MPAQQLVISLVYSLADSLWLAAGLWLCYRFIDWLMPLRPVHAYRLASILVTTLFVGWLAIFILYLAGGKFVSSIAFHQLSWTTQFDIPQVWINVAACLYMLGLSFHVVRFFYSNYCLRRLLSETIPMTGEWKSMVDRHTGNTSRQGVIQVFFSDRISSPFTFGWLRPVILFPVASINNLTINEFESILLHELAHIRRNDYLLQRIMALMEMTLFFNLFARDLFRIIRFLREECCDDEVLAAGTLPLDYVTALNWCARQGIAFGGTLGAVGTDRELLNRILRMTGGSTQKRTPATYFYWVAFLGIVMGIQFSNIFSPIPSGNLLPMTVSEGIKIPMVKGLQKNTSFTTTANQQKKKVQQSAVRKKAMGRGEEKNSDNATTVAVASPDIIQTVSLQEDNDLITLQQGWKQIRQLSREELGQLMREALQEFNAEDKITWARVIRNKLLAQEMRNYSVDSTSMTVSDYAIAERQNSPEATRVQSKLMLLIWMKWREKHPRFIEQLLHKYPIDSVQFNPVSEQ